MNSPLPHTGRCHKCGAETLNRFCSDVCRSSYSYYKRHPKATKRGPESKPKNRTKLTKQQERGYMLTGRMASAKQIEANIERIVARAIQAGTCYNVAQIAPNA